MHLNCVGHEVYIIGVGEMKGTEIALENKYKITSTKLSMNIYLE